MKKYLYSFRVRLFVSVLILVLQVLVLGYLNQRTNEHTDQIVSQAYQTGQMRSNVYLLASLARRLAATEDEATRQGILTLMQDSIANFETIQDGLRNGNEVLQLVPIRQQELLVVLDELDIRWAGYRSLLESYMRADQTTQDELASQIDQQSVTVFTFADRLSLGIDIIVEQEIRGSTRLSTAMAIVTLLATLLAIYVVLQVTRSTNRITRVVSDFAGGDYSIRAEENRLVEFKQLGQGFNEMAQRIETQIKEISAARDEAERSNQVKVSFLASMSHELRTPLNAIINFSRFLAEGDLGTVSDVQKETLLRVVSAARHLLNLINDVLDMSKIESGALRLFVTENVDLNDILDNVAASSKTFLAGKSVALHTEIDPNLPRIRADRQRILQILLNVTSNACKFTDTGYVKIRAYPLNGEVVFAVEDTGAGIAPEDHAAVFESFKQTPSGIRKGSGTGLGMPISKNLVEVHGGRLWFESQVNKGSTFFVAIPVKAEHLTTVTVNEEKKHETGRIVRRG